MKKAFVMIIIVAAIILAVVSSAYAQTTSCLSLGNDLFPGDKSASVKFLQTFLNVRGYLSATPNGVYGPATTAAVKAFQRDNSISQTGNVGPATRNAISTKGCSTLPNQSVNVISSIPTVAPTPAPAQTQTISIVSPQDGEIWMIGKTYTINWNTPTGYLYDIVLDNRDGSSGGFISHNSINGNSFIWKAGDVITALGAQTMATGTYRVRIQSSSGVESSKDPVSGWFTLIGPPLTVNSIMPTTASADSNTSVLLYGSGFDSTATVRLDSEYGFVMNKQYTSPDGTVLVFSIPQGVSAGSHILYISTSNVPAKSVGSITVTN